ncbi:hypothetical protein [Brunnivagina elsteri]|nr:hypothetical protein [Calothrix elsteri]
MTLIKKSEQLLLLKMKNIEEEEQNLEPETKDVAEVNREPKRIIIEK